MLFGGSKASITLEAMSPMDGGASAFAGIHIGDRISIIEK
jgi:hypothetical protein